MAWKNLAPAIPPEVLPWETYMGPGLTWSNLWKKYAGYGKTASEAIAFNENKLTKKL